MEKQAYFWGKGVSVDLARVLAFGRPNAVGIGEVLSRRRMLRVTLEDGPDLVIEGDEDTDEFIAAMDAYLESARP